MEPITGGPVGPVEHERKDKGMFDTLSKKFGSLRGKPVVVKEESPPVAPVGHESVRKSKMLERASSTNIFDVIIEPQIAKYMETISILLKSGLGSEQELLAFSQTLSEVDRDNYQKKGQLLINAEASLKEFTPEKIIHEIEERNTQKLDKLSEKIFDQTFKKLANEHGQLLQMHLSFPNMKLDEYRDALINLGRKIEAFESTVKETPKKRRAPPPPPTMKKTESQEWKDLEKSVEDFDPKKRQTTVEKKQ